MSYQVVEVSLTFAWGSSVQQREGTLALLLKFVTSLRFYRYRLSSFIFVDRVVYLDFLGRSLESYHLSPKQFQRFRNRCHKTLGSQMSCWFHLSLSASKEASQCGVLFPSLTLMQYTLWFRSLLKLSCYRFLQLAEGLPRMRRATAFLPLETG